MPGWRLFIFIECGAGVVKRFRWVHVEMSALGCGLRQPGAIAPGNVVQLFPIGFPLNVGMEILFQD